MKLIAKLAFIGFVVFVAWVLYIANTGQQAMFSWLLVDIPYGDKVGHFGLFSTLTILAIWASNFRVVYIWRIPCYWATLVVLLFVAIEELSQYFIPSRRMDIYDFYADAAGIILASLLATLLHAWLYRKHRKQLNSVTE
ncbi:VanZ family protein [Thalassotalea maritima]|uniref:VanZ family protein n=1 Tax=Thalassotalea maritima TaxID=3242416 RepID=UPI0035274F17